MSESIGPVIRVYMCVCVCVRGCTGLQYVLVGWGVLLYCMKYYVSQFVCIKVLCKFILND